MSTKEKLVSTLNSNEMKTLESPYSGVPYAFAEANGTGQRIHVGIFLSGNSYTLNETTEQNVPVFTYSEAAATTTDVIHCAYHDVDSVGVGQLLAKVKVGPSGGPHKTTMIYETPIGGGSGK